MDNSEDSNKADSVIQSDFEETKQNEISNTNKLVVDCYPKGIQRCKNFKDLKEFFESANSKLNSENLKLTEIKSKQNPNKPKAKCFPPVKITIFNKAQKNQDDKRIPLEVYRTYTSAVIKPIKVNEIKEYFENKNTSSTEDSGANRLEVAGECENHTLSTFVTDTATSDMSLDLSHKKLDENDFKVVCPEKTLDEITEYKSKSATLSDSTLSRLSSLSQTNSVKAHENPAI
jgi:hypothetical protein